MVIVINAARACHRLVVSMGSDIVAAIVTKTAVKFLDSPVLVILYLLAKPKVTQKENPKEYNKPHVRACATTNFSTPWGKTVFKNPPPFPPLMTYAYTFHAMVYVQYKYNVPLSRFREKEHHPAAKAFDQIPLCRLNKKSWHVSHGAHVSGKSRIRLTAASSPHKFATYRLVP
jgi:hypothetical protein